MWPRSSFGCTSARTGWELQGDYSQISPEDWLRVPRCSPHQRAHLPPSLFSVALSQPLQSRCHPLCTAHALSLQCRSGGFNQTLAISPRVVIEVV